MVCVYVPLINPSIIKAKQGRRYGQIFAPEVVELRVGAFFVCEGVERSAVTSVIGTKYRTMEK